MPTNLACHPFHYADYKEQARIRKQPATKYADRLEECGAEFYMDFGFMRSSTSDYAKPNKLTNRIVLSYDGYSSYLLIVDGSSRRTWVFLTKTKEPPIHIVRAFMKKFGAGGGLVKTDQGGELARSAAFKTMLEEEFHYVVEPTGADSPSQNGAAEIYNNKFALKHGPSSTTPTYQQNFGPQHSSTQYTFTTGWYTQSQRQHHTRHGTVGRPTFLI
jgi:hypothetical protein